jgi:hypothetical protein
VLTDEKAGQIFLRSIFNPTHHFVNLYLDILAVQMAFVRKRCGGKFSWSILADSSPKLIFGTLRYSKTLTTNQLCRHDEGENHGVNETRRLQHAGEESSPPPRTFSCAPARDPRGVRSPGGSSLRR